MADYTNFTVETDADGIALVTWDMPDRSMNVIDVNVGVELASIIEHVATTDTIKGAVLCSGKKTFGAGADLSMLEDMLDDFAEQKAKDPEAAAKDLFENAYALNKNLRNLETCGKPWVAA
ncbi:MAG: 3-hydroxyacyl-CoA dehydrogenase, partial [Pseudomonadota bacterium]